MPRPEVTVEGLRVGVYVVPTDAPESDGTAEWSATTLVVVEADGGGRSGLGYTYADRATGALVTEALAEVVRGRDAMDVPGAYAAMAYALRNHGRRGAGAMALSAVDVALWDLKCRLLDLPLVTLLGACRAAAPAYGSGGFTSYCDARLAAQLGGWAAEGLARVKMKVGREPARDPERVRVAREAVGDAVELFVDANGAYTAKQALALAERFAERGVTWFEEPVSSDHLEQLRLLRERAPAGIDVAAGEYGYEPFYFRRMLDAGAVDVLQADATRCGGVTGFARVAALCEAFGVPLSAHCAPALHTHPACALAPVAHVERFYDHARVEAMLFDGAPALVDGALAPDLSRPGLGLDLRRADADRFAV